MKKAILFFFLFAMKVGIFCVHAQVASPDIDVKKIDVSLENPPRYNVTVGKQRQNTAPKPWLVVEAELECKVEWADEVQVKFFVVANYGPQAKEKPQDGYDVLTSTVTVVNMAKNVNGGRNVVPVFLDANTVKKYGASGKDQFVPEVAVQVMFKGVLQDTKWMKSPSNGRFWEQKQPKVGVLLNVMQSPWYPAFSEYFEQVKPSGGVPAY